MCFHCCKYLCAINSFTIMANGTVTFPQTKAGSLSFIYSRDGRDIKEKNNTLVVNMRDSMQRQLQLIAPSRTLFQVNGTVPGSAATGAWWLTNVVKQ